MRLRAKANKAAVSAVIEDHSGRLAQVGAGSVRRLLPTLNRRSVGPWCFVDHFGPTEIEPAAGGGIGPHPHAGLQTVTWLLEGAMDHRDSLGSRQRIHPGQVNWMTSGRGISHAELRPDDARGTVHGVQLWVALPDSARGVAPAFDHYAEVPTLEHAGASVMVIAGEHAGIRHDVRAFSPLVGLDVRSTGGPCRLPIDPAFEHAVAVTEGSPRVEGTTLALGTLRYLGVERSHIQIDAKAGDRMLVLGGEPLPVPLLMWWNFVARTHEEIVEMQRAWNLDEGRFGTVHGSGLERIRAPSL